MKKILFLILLFLCSCNQNSQITQEYANQMKNVHDEAVAYESQFDYLNYDSICIANKTLRELRENENTNSYTYLIKGDTNGWNDAIGNHLEFKRQLFKQLKTTNCIGDCPQTYDGGVDCRLFFITEIRSYQFLSENNNHELICNWDSGQFVESLPHGRYYDPFSNLVSSENYTFNTFNDLEELYPCS